MEGNIVNMGAYIGAGLACIGMGCAAIGVGNVAGGAGGFCSCVGIKDATGLLSLGASVSFGLTPTPPGRRGPRRGTKAFERYRSSRRKD